MNSKAEYRHNSLIRHRIEFKGVIWQDNLPESKTEPITLPEPTDNNEVSLFHKQIKQRKISKRKISQESANGTSEPSQRAYPSLESTPRITECDPEMPSITHVSPDFPEKIQNPKVQLYVKGTLVEALPMAKRRKN